MSHNHHDNHQGHSHHHGHSHSVTSLKKSYYIGIGLNMVFILTEVFAGLWMNSLSLLSDAGHNFSDVISLVLSVIAIRLATVKPTEKFTYGFKKSTILAAFFNAVLLLFTIGAISWEAIKRFNQPVEVQGTTIAYIALIGIFVNGISALFFFGEKEMNARAAFMHLLADALISLGVVIGGFIISKTGWYWIDPAMSLIIILVILFGTWSLFRDSLQLSLDAVPKDISVPKIEGELSKIKGVNGVHHTHIWAISTTEFALTTHLMVSKNSSFDELQKIKNEAKHLLEHQNIQHATIEVEGDEGECVSEKC
jgi:cobalt-zinc-cadmium efflux system protein